MIIWCSAVLFGFVFVWIPIIRSELDDANQMIENEIKNRNQDGF